MPSALPGGGSGEDRRKASQAGRLRAASAVVRHNFSGQTGGFAGVKMQAVMHLALAGNHRTIRGAQLLEYREAECAPEQVSMVIGEQCIVDRGEDDDRGIEAGQIEQSALLPIRERQCEIEWHNQYFGCPEAEPGEVFQSAFTHVRAGLKARFEQSDSGRRRQGGAETAAWLWRGDGDTRAESSPQEWEIHLSR